MNVNSKTNKMRILSILTVLYIVFSMTPLTAFALENDESIISTMIYTEMPRTYINGSAVTDFTPAVLAANTGYDYFWCIDKYNGETYVGTWWPDSMNSLAYAYSYWDEFTENEIDSWKTAFGTTFDNNYDYTFYGIALLKSDYSFSSTLQFNVTYTDNSTDAETISTDSWDTAYWAEDLSVAPVHTHNWTTDYPGQSETHHWNTCADCTITDIAQMNGYGMHNYDNEQYTSCNTCGYTRTVKPTNTYNGVLVKGTAATCTENGVKDYYKGENGKFFVDAACTREIVNLDLWKVITAAGHTDTDNNKKCDTCGAAVVTVDTPQVDDSDSGSHLFLWFALLIVFVGGIAAFVIFRKKKK